MPVYMVERDVPGVTLAQLTAIRRAARDMCARFVAAGRPVRCRRGLFLPGESRGLCLFEAPDAALVQELNDAAQIPYSRIIMALDLDP